MLPFGIAALTAFDAMRKRAAGRWILQLVAAAPIAGLVYLTVANAS
jgi:hypothetical protein